jgi:endonuclease YncB( thermonuclease family)
VVLGVVLVVGACHQMGRSSDVEAAPARVSERSAVAQSSGGVVEEAGAEFAWPDVGGLVENVWDDLAAAWVDAAREDPVACEHDGGRYSGLPGCHPGGQAATVRRVVDGDTLVLTDGREVQLIGVDAPEAGECAGDGAMAHVRARVDGRDVTLHREPGVDRDRSGRPLFYIRYDGPGDSYDLGYSLAYNGLARPYPPYAGNYRYTANVAEAVERARAADAGAHGAVCDPVPAPARDDERTDEDRTPAVAAPAPAPRPSPRPAPRPQPAPAPQPRPAAGTGCHPGYEPCVPTGRDLDCGEVGYRVRVVGPDEYRLDADDDGSGCESEG